VENAQGLNDVTIDKNGVIYVSDSKGKKIFRVENGKGELFLDNLKGPNGVLMRGDDFYILDAGGMYKVEKDKSLTKITDGMEGGTDGIENVTGNDFIISCWAESVVCECRWHKKCWIQGSKRGIQPISGSIPKQKRSMCLRSGKIRW
jgi:hypothetical protein